MPNCPVLVEAIGLSCRCANRLTPYCSSFVRSSSANFTRSRICFSTGGAAELQIIDHGFREGGRERHRAVGDFFARDMAVEGHRIAGAVGHDLLVGERVFQDLPQRIQIQIHGDVVERALARLAPDHHGGVAETLAVHQDLARGDGAGVDDVGVAGGDLADVGRDSRSRRSCRPSDANLRRSGRRPRRRRAGAAAASSPRDRIAGARPADRLLM